MNYIQLAQAIQDYSENTEQLFVLNIPTFVKEAEQRIYNSVQLAALRRNVIGQSTAGSKYLTLPTDWLSTYSIAVIDNSGNYTYLLNKDVNFLREAYPNQSTSGFPKYYSIFGPNSSDPEGLTAILAPAPDDDYAVELHYFYYPTSIVQGEAVAVSVSNGGSSYVNGVYYNVPLTGGSGTGATANIVVSSNVITSATVSNPGSLYIAGDTVSASSSSLGGSGSGFTGTISAISNETGTSWLGDNYDPALFYGAMREAILFMKGEQDLVGYYEQKYQEAIMELKRLGDGLERGDAYRDGQTKLKVNS